MVTQCSKASHALTRDFHSVSNYWLENQLLSYVKSDKNAKLPDGFQLCQIWLIWDYRMSLRDLVL